ncbi:Glutathione S-transferase [Phytophthora megakarya]|uniref:Glutathione S-transferase n=1 Tax=Phytophthora megakarya TaxID=4795 RepID=A0A225V964_9STRA|nr:Glutathione S-transferase [Phytophthora megakarya]
MAVKGFVFKSAKAQNKPPSKFRNFIERSTNAAFPAEKDRYHLYVSYACPWASRCLSTMYLKRLDNIIGLSVVHPLMQRTRPDDKDDVHTGWTFVDPATTPSLTGPTWTFVDPATTSSLTGPTGHGTYSSKGCIPDTVNNTHFIRDLYEKCTSEKTAYSVPLLWDKKQNTIVSNDSADIVRMFNSAFVDLVPSTLDLYPEDLRSQIDEINDWIYHDVSHGVYKCGFAGSQELYDAAVDKVFEGLDRCEEILSKHRFLVGDRLTEADLKLFPTLVRFDEVYAVHFKANKKLIQQYPNLSNYVRDIYQLPRMSETVVMSHIAAHYYGSHTHLNQFGIVPAGPKIDFSRPHDRDRFTDAILPTI